MLKGSLPTFLNMYPFFVMNILHSSTCSEICSTLLLSVATLLNHGVGRSWRTELLLLQDFSLDIIRSLTHMLCLNIYIYIPFSCYVGNHSWAKIHGLIFWNVKYLICLFIRFTQAAKILPSLNKWIKAMHRNTFSTWLFLVISLTSIIESTCLPNFVPLREGILNHNMYGSLNWLEGEYGWDTFYTCMNMELWNLSKSFKKESRGKRRIMEGWPKLGYNICVYGNFLSITSYTNKTFKNSYKWERTTY
jgi:hypothetical protein